MMAGTTIKVICIMCKLNRTKKRKPAPHCYCFTCTEVFKSPLNAECLNNDRGD